jgi:hypothetical protein
MSPWKPPSKQLTMEAHENHVDNSQTHHPLDAKEEHPSSDRPMAVVDRTKRDEWSEGAVTSLLDAYEAKWVLRNRAKLKGQDWEDVAKAVSARAGDQGRIQGRRQRAPGHPLGSLKNKDRIVKNKISFDLNILFI